ncbi:TPA: hypothetical protein LQC23_002168, partial [Enterococcus faecium]|nr:hypothetical protein [Enterococcus faecium]
MDSKIEIMTLGMLKKQLSKFEASAGVSDDTKIFLDTGWDSIQEIAPDALEVAQAR